MIMRAVEHVAQYLVVYQLHPWFVSFLQHEAVDPPPKASSAAPAYESPHAQGRGCGQAGRQLLQIRLLCLICRSMRPAWRCGGGLMCSVRMKMWPNLARLLNAYISTSFVSRCIVSRIRTAAGPGGCCSSAPTGGSPAC